MTDGQTRERIGHLYDYLSALAQEVYAKPVRHVGDHDIAASPGDIPDHPSVRLGGAAGDAWLRVRKTPKPVPPGLPGDVSHLLRDVVRSEYAPPQLPPDLGSRHVVSVRGRSLKVVLSAGLGHSGDSHIPWDVEVRLGLPMESGARPSRVRGVSTQITRTLPSTVMILQLFAYPCGANNCKITAGGAGRSLRD